MYSCVKMRSFVLVLILGSVFVMGSEKKDDKEDIFVAEKEWKTIREGQKIPKGLHVRINLETGLKEAKLLEKEEGKSNALLSVPNKEEAEEALPPQLRMKKELENAMKNIKSDESTQLSPDEIKKIKDKFRSYDEIKKDLKDLNLTPKLDSEIISDLIAKHKVENNIKNYTNILNILEDLEYLTHQIDNAINFVTQNGFNEIIYINLNSTNTAVKSETLRLVSSLTQNNPKVQIHALETGAIRTLLKMLLFESDVNLKIRTLTTLGCVIRRFPAAQTTFIEQGGLSVFSKIFDEVKNIKIHVKLATLVNDLLNEHLDTLKEPYDANQKELLRQYTLINLKERLLEHEWCENLNKLLLAVLIHEENNHEFFENTLHAMHSLKELCSWKYSKEVLLKVGQKYNSLAMGNEQMYTEDSNDTYYLELSEIANNIIRSRRDEIKTEL